MRTVQLIERKRNGEELSPEEVCFLVEGFTRGEIPDFQMSAFLMAVCYAGLGDREVSALTDCLIRSGETVDLSTVPGVKVNKRSTGGVGDKTSLIAGPLAAAAGVVIPLVTSRAFGYVGGTLDRLEAIPGFRTNFSADEVRSQLVKTGLCFFGQSPAAAPAESKLAALRELTATVSSIPLIAASIMAKEMAMDLDALVLDIKVGSGSFISRQIDARRLAQTMAGIGRRMDLRVQALITDMNQPLGYAIGNALEVMEASQTLQNAGPADLTRLSLELAARIIYLGKGAENLEQARDVAQRKLLDGSGYHKFKQVIQEQGGNPAVLDRFDLLPNASGAREIVSPRSGFVSAIDAGDIGRASSMIGAGRQNKEDQIDPAVGVILEVKAGERIEAGSVLCRLYYTREDRLDEAAQLVEDAFRVSTHPPDDRELILETVG